MKYTNILLLLLLFLPGNVSAQQNQWKLVWDKNSDSDLVSHYIVYRGIGTEPTVNDSFCIALHPSNTDQDSVMIIDSLLEIDTEYFYNVVAVDMFGRRSGFSETVSAIHYPPIAKNDYITTKEDVRINLWATNNDRSYISSLVNSSVTLVSKPKYGYAKTNPAGRVYYYPPPNWHGTVDFRYTVSDSDGALSNRARIRVTVVPQNDLPIVTDLPDSIYLSPDSSVSLNLDTYFKDVETPDSLIRFEFSSESDRILWNLQPESNNLTLATKLGLSAPSLFFIKAIDDSNAFVLDSIHIFSKIYSGFETNTYDRLPQRHELFHNYPNPFNPSTTIKIALRKSEHVRLDLFNALGQSIKVLVDNQLPAGYHEIEFNAQNLPSGVYFYSIQAGAFRDMKKLILLK